MKTMRNLLAALAVSSALCSFGETSEAERFGYRGDDLTETTNRLFLVTGAGVTNWVPERVLSVSERYDLTERETALVKAAGVLMPGAAHKALPEGYAQDSVEPWFVWWTHPATSFGLTGRVGVLSHFNEQSAEWETGLSYFSCYWDTKEKAEAALAGVRRQLEAEFGVKRFHDLEGGWVAEYVRLLVMGVVGQKPDGSWSCMINFRDKCNDGCGSWEPVPEQQRIRNTYEYAKAMKAWRQKKIAVLEENRRLIAEAAAKAGLTEIEDLSAPSEIRSGVYARAAQGLMPLPEEEAARTAQFDAVWTERQALVEKAFGVKPVREPALEEVPGLGKARWQIFASDLYQIRLVVVQRLVPEDDAPAADEETAGEAVEEKPVRLQLAPVQWELIVCDVPQPGMRIPEPPKEPK